MNKKDKYIKFLIFSNLSLVLIVLGFVYYNISTHQIKTDIMTKELQQSTGIINVQQYRQFVSRNDWTKAFQECYKEAKKNNAQVYIPSGNYILKKTIYHSSNVNTVGAGKNLTNILIDHDDAAFDFEVGDNKKVPQQGGNTKFSGMTIKRLHKTNEKISGNYGIRLHGTFGHTVFEDLIIRDMGDSAVKIFDETGMVGTGPISFREVKAESNLYGYGLDCQGLFANIFLDSFHSWGNAGLYRFDGTPIEKKGFRKTNYLPFQIVIRDSDSEYSGGFTGGSKNENISPLAPQPLPALYARYVRGLVIDGVTLQTSHGSGKPVIDIDYSENISIKGASDIISRGASNKDGTTTNQKGKNLLNTDAIVIGSNTKNVFIGDSVNIFGNNSGRFGINAQAVSQLTIDQPKISGFRDRKDLKIQINNPKEQSVYIKNNVKDGFLRSSYTGSLSNVNLK